METNKLLSCLSYRSAIFQSIRQFFFQRNFLEVDTPLLVSYPSQEPYLEPFATTVRNERGKEFSGYLIMSPEFSMKKLLASGSGNIFQLSHVFRNNESFSGTHQPEFTLLEWYEVGNDYHALMNTMEELVCYCSSMSRTSPSFNPPPSGKGEERWGMRPWPRKTVTKLFSEFCSIDISKLKDENDWRNAAQTAGMQTQNTTTADDGFWWLFLNFIEPNLPKDKPIFITDYPLFQAALARRKPNNQNVAERVELFVDGLELANGFTELNDPKEQRERFLSEQKIRALQNRPIYPIDEEFISALSSLPPCAGCALGIDRLIMLLLDVKDINEVVPLSTNMLFK